MLCAAFSQNEMFIRSHRALGVEQLRRHRLPTRAPICGLPMFHIQRRGQRELTSTAAPTELSGSVVARLNRGTIILTDRRNWFMSDLIAFFFAFDRMEASAA